MQNQPHIPLCVALLTLLATACGTFDREWQQAMGRPSAGVSGAWVGQWHSDHNGHEGALRCVITPKSPELVNAHFQARYIQWCLPLSFSSRLDMLRREDNGTSRFTGSADLGWLAGGVYRYEGNGTAQELMFDFRSAGDHGTFRLRRPQ